MFYSEALLAKNGPLARVWLASNMERKLTKANVLHEKLEQKVADIIGTGQAPMALRMSGQLLLGVVRIYSKKAEYLKTDCNDVLLKIKMAFRPGNVDMTTSHSRTADKNALLLPDTITELDLFATLPDPDDLFREHQPRTPGRDPTLLDFGTSQFLTNSQHQTPSKRHTTMMLDEDDLGLDLGLEPREAAVQSPRLSEPSIEIGRRAQTPKKDEPSLLNMEDDLGLDMGYADDTAATLLPMPPMRDDDVPMLGMEDDYNNNNDNSDIAQANAAALARVDAATARRNQRQRDTASPLSSVRPSVERDLEASFLQTHLDDEDHTTVRAAQRIKRRKVLPQDHETELPMDQIKAQQADRSGITKPPSFLPRDPLLLQLMEMQRNGGFVSGVVGDGRMLGWAPELRGILSVELLQGGMEKQKKRKRDSGVADLEDTDGEAQQNPPRLHLPQEEDEGFHAVDFSADTTLQHSDGPMLNLNDDDAALHNAAEVDQFDDGPAPAPYDPAFDTTLPAVLPPSQSGPISLGTQSAVTLLRAHLAPKTKTSTSSPSSPPTPNSRLKTSALFTDFCPEASTSRETATKLFFELLVLGTKDAVKIAQETGDGVLGGAMRIRGCRGLWGEFGSGRLDDVGEGEAVGGIEG